MKVKDCMCHDVCFVKPETKVSEVAKLMAKNHIGCVPVCDNNNSVCGILTDRDLVLRCMACGKDACNTPVSDVMSCNVETCKDTDDITNAESLMGQNQIRRLPVCDNQNRVIGMLTLSDLTKNNNEVGKEEFCNMIEDICDCNGNKNAQ